MATNNAINNTATQLPCFTAYLDTTVTNVTGDATHYTVLFDNTLVNIGNCYNIATGIFTAPTAGYYHFDYSLGFLSNTVNGGIVLGSYYRIGGSNFYGSELPTTMRLAGFHGTSNVISLTNSIDLNFNIGGTIYVAVISQSGAKTDGLQGLDAGSIYYTTFSGYRIR